MIFIISMCALIALCVFLKRKYANPYKLIFIFGKKDLLNRHP